MSPKAKKPKSERRLIFTPFWRGVLQERRASTRPATQTGLAYVLVTEDEQLPVYIAHSAPKFAPYAGRHVVARGKGVDLSGEGYGKELWVASIQLVE
jgi:hypothetical protein